MHNTGSLKGSDVKKMCAGVLPYLFGDRLPAIQQASADAMFEALELALTMTCNVDDMTRDHEADFAGHNTKMAELITTFERGAPQSELCMLVHELIHIPDSVYWWNNVRNFWVFFTERYASRA
jgi:hypothetical protein